MKKDNILDSIKIIDNILTEEERVNLFIRSRRFLEKIPGCPGLQTQSNLHMKCQVISSIIKKIAEKSSIPRTVKTSWVNFTDKDIAYESWHNHDYPGFYNVTCVYMLDNPEGIGAWINIDNKIYKTECPTNSLILLPCEIKHTVPPNVTMPRYSLAIDFSE